MGLTARAHRHLDYDKAAQAIFTDPEIAEVGVAEAEAFAAGRKLRVTKVPFSANPKALINGDTRGFVKILSDPATNVVLGEADTVFHQRAETGLQFSPLQSLDLRLTVAADHVDADTVWRERRVGDLFVLEHLGPAVLVIDRRLHSRSP
jgi:hypothetical protein